MSIAFILDGVNVYPLMFFKNRFIISIKVKPKAHSY
tara:strand:- start:2032 stop:2139 length:108 start_codon:yes stop_codon:yes gene_type:complete